MVSILRITSSLEIEFLIRPVKSENKIHEVYPWCLPLRKEIPSKNIANTSLVKEFYGQLICLN
jgi:hypothetical protein